MTCRVGVPLRCWPRRDQAGACLGTLQAGRLTGILDQAVPATIGNFEQGKE